MSCGGALSAGPGSRIVPPVRTPRVLLAALSVGAAAALAGCGADPYPGVPDEGTVHAVFVSEMNGFDPVRSSEEIRSLCVLNTYDALYEYDYLRRPYALRPCLAAAMPEVSADGLVWRIPMKRGATYVDDPCFVATGGKGREATAHDVVFDLLRLMDPTTPTEGSWVLEGKVVGLDAFTKAAGEKPPDAARAAYTAADGYPEVAGLRAVDDHTVEIRLTQPYPQLLWVLAMPYTSVYPPEAVAFYGEEFLNHAVGTGPYRVAQYRPSQRLVLERRTGYRDDRYPDEAAGAEPAGFPQVRGRPLPLNERVVATVIKEDQPSWLYFESGYADRLGIPKDSYDTVIDDKTKELRPKYRDRGVRLWREPSMEVIYDAFNMKHPVVGPGEKARAIRRAVSLATNYAWAIQHLYNDRVEDMQGPIPRGCEEYDDGYRNPWKPQPGETRAQALDRARAELAKVGLRDPKDIPDLVVDVLDSATDDDHFLAWQRDCRDVGIRLKPYKTTWQGMNARVLAGEAMVYGQAWMADYPDAQNFLQLFYGPNIPSPNGSAYQNAAYDALYERWAFQPPSAERTEAFRRLQRTVVDEDCVWVVRYRRVTWYLQQPWVAGWHPQEISSKWFKYMHVDAAQRRATLAQWNAPRPTLLLVGLGAFLVLAGATVVRGSRRTRGW